MNPTTPPRVPARLVPLYYENGKQAGESRELDCPFCQQTHFHGSALGHRSAHCNDYVPRRRQKVDPRDVQKTPGYVLCDPGEDVDWALERISAQLLVLRNKHQRLSAEYANLDPWTARERKVKQHLGEEIAGIADVLCAAGVQL